MKKIKFAILSVLALLVASCASQPSTTSAPSWVMNPPRDQGSDYVFVGSGSASNPARAEQDATANLLAQINQEIGVKITTTTNAVAKATLNSYQAEIEQAVKSEANARVSGFKIAERFQLVNKDGSLTIYIKALYNKSELDKEKKRIQAIFTEQDEAVSKPEKEGDRLAASGRYFDAIEKYIQAASAAASSSVENAEIKFERNINKAREVIGKVSIIPLNPGLTTNVGQAFPANFDFKVVYGSQESDPAIPMVNLRVSYKVKRNNRITIAGATVKTDQSGVAHFTHPIPDFAAKDNLTVVLDVNTFIETLAAVPRQFRDQVSSLEDSAAKNKAMIPFSIQSNAKNIPLAFLILDLNQEGSALKKGETAAGVAESLTKAGFKVSIISGVDAAFLKTADDSEALAKLKSAVGPNVKRIGFGTVNISEVSEGSRATARAGGTIKVLDLTTGDVLFSLNKNKRATGSSAEGAISSAFRTLGNDIGTAMVDELP